MKQRLGKTRGKPIDGDFPSTARTAFTFVLADLRDKGYLVEDGRIFREVNRIGRLTREEFEEVEKV